MKFWRNLAYLLYVGSPQSREGDDRKEALLELILKKLDPEEAGELLTKLNRKYPKRA